ncbi:DUF5082 domain-containing protein [Rummeliibacillus pycnus]|uniref:DUF5082 domain-containing protein n=1 Tax=Rummeliibacillus pycnus TaxID=101070 RepID=UPI0037C65690
MSLGYYYALLREKEEQLKRLQACNGQLHAHQQDFIEYESKIIQPTLSSSTWQGMLANKFDQTRTEQMLTEYRDLDGQQFSSVYQVLGDKIKSLQEEILAIKAIIKQLEAELAAQRKRN